jgi:hypothetical protein
VKFLCRSASPRATSTLQWRIGLKALDPERPIREADVALNGFGNNCRPAVSHSPARRARCPRQPRALPAARSFSVSPNSSVDRYLALVEDNSTYVAQNVKHVDELIAIQASVWGRATAVGENVDKAIEIYNPKFWRTAGLGAKRLVGIHFSYVTNSDSHFYADDDPEVHKFVFNEVKKLADPTASAKSVSGVRPEGVVGAQDMQKVKAAMTLLKSVSEILGPAKIEGADPIEGNVLPAVFFGATKMNNNFSLVDEIVKQVGGTATIFVKSGADYVRVATNVKRDDGSRAIGTILDPKGKVIEFINGNEAFYGEATILGKRYLTGYEPMQDEQHNVIGIYYFGYLVSGSLTSQEQQTVKR